MNKLIDMAYQGLTPTDGKYEILFKAKGSQLMGIPLSAPLSQHSVVYTLPMMTVSSTKGTGVVTSVPSDSPDDFAALRDLQQKQALREKFGIEVKKKFHSLFSLQFEEKKKKKKKKKKGIMGYERSYSNH